MKTRSATVAQSSVIVGLLFTTHCAPNPIVALGTDSAGGAIDPGESDGIAGSGGTSGNPAIPGSDEPGGTGSQLPDDVAGGSPSPGGSGSTYPMAFSGAPAAGATTFDAVGGAAAGGNAGAGGESSSTGVTQVAAGLFGTCAVYNDQVYCWGAHDWGDLTGSTARVTLLPRKLQGIPANVTSIAVGSAHAAAAASGNLYGWGTWAGRQSNTPILIASAVNEAYFTRVAANYDETIGLAPRWAEVTASSRNSYQLSVGVLDDVVGCYRHFCGIGKGRAYCFGENYWGELGNDPMANSVALSPVVGLDSGVTAIATGYYSSCAVKDGEAYCWGVKIGAAASVAQLTPVKVAGLPREVTSIGAGDGTACAVADGAVYCWGRNERGQLGSGTATDVPVASPIAVRGLGSGASFVSVGGSHACAIVERRLYCWGSNMDLTLGTRGAMSLCRGEPCSLEPMEVLFAE